MMVTTYLTLDFCCSNFKTVPPLLSPAGGPVFKAGPILIWGLDLGPITPQIARSPGRGALISMGMPGEALSKEYRCPLALISRVLDFPLKQFSEEIFFFCIFQQFSFCIWCKWLFNYFLVSGKYPRSLTADRLTFEALPYEQARLLYGGVAAFKKPLLRAEANYHIAQYF